MMKADARLPPLHSAAEEADDNLHLARLSIEDMDRLALSWRSLALQGDETTVAIAKAMVSVAERRHAAAIARVRILAAYRTWAPLRRVAEWALLRQRASSPWPWGGGAGFRE